MQSIQTYVAEVGLGYNHTAPYWMGEFGTGSDSENWGKIVRFLNETDHDWAYWSIDGYKYPDQGKGNTTEETRFDNICRRGLRDSQ